MSKLNEDILHLIFKELRNNRRCLHSCLLVNKTWFRIVIPILWKNPWKFINRGREELLLNVIFSHLPEDLKNHLDQDIIISHKKLLINYQKPLINYINFCKYLNLNKIKGIIDRYIYKVTIKNEIINLFINENTKFSHLYIPQQFNYQLHLIPGAKHCFSELEFLSCSTNINDNVLDGLTEMCKSIKKLELIVEKINNNNYGIVKLIHTTKNLSSIRYLPRGYPSDDEFCKVLESSLIKQANSIQHFKIIIKQPITEFLSFLVNLKRLEISYDGDSQLNMWNSFENLSLPFLQILKANCVPANILTNLIENTNRSLIEISIENIIDDSKRITQVIYQNCPNLKYLKLVFRNNSILELEQLLICCKHLDGLCIIDDADEWDGNFNWIKLFEILTKFSPTYLFKFKFQCIIPPRLEYLKLFFDKWKGRYPMLFQFNQLPTQYMYFCTMISDIGKYSDLIEKYKTMGVVKKETYTLNEVIYKDFEWIQEKNI